MWAAGSEKEDSARVSVCFWGGRGVLGSPDALGRSCTPESPACLAMTARPRPNSAGHL